MSELLRVHNLHIELSLREGTVKAVNGVNITINRGEVLGLVGESGCGKSITARAILQILPPRAKIAAGQIQLASRDSHSDSLDLATLDPKGDEIRRIRGSDVSMVFQEPMTSLSPVHTVGSQIMEAILLHQNVGRSEARRRAVQVLREVGVPMSDKRLNSYPHELSGGLRQRCVIAMALSCRPRLLIADEPTTALDVTIQAQILELLKQFQRQLGMSIIMITHDLGVIAETADRVAVMYLGRIVETAPSEILFGNPHHPYTRGLLASVPRIGRDRDEDLPSIQGRVPHPFETVRGCPFHPRCDRLIPGVCDRDAAPEAIQIAPEHFVACHLYSAEKPRRNKEVLGGMS
ncbi:MAG TPA: ABC transporter ATP-binding protein [bacterium]|nr:ABC transporter ATP-binding protein [bacterium]